MGVSQTRSSALRFIDHWEDPTNSEFTSDETFRLTDLEEFDHSHLHRLLTLRRQSLTVAAPKKTIIASMRQGNTPLAQGTAHEGRASGREGTKRPCNENDHQPPPKRFRFDDSTLRGSISLVSRHTFSIVRQCLILLHAAAFLPILNDTTRRTSTFTARQLCS